MWFLNIIGSGVVTNIFLFLILAILFIELVDKDEGLL